MGWKASTIIINKPTRVNNEDLLKTLGFDNFIKIEDEPFEVAINPDDNKVYIGTYRDNLLICVPDIPMQFFEDNESQTEKTLNIPA
jgi:DNA-binding beta-propeller fold protein YncE